MQVILLERVEKLGQIGDTVSVKDGFARNFLLPKKKALRATDANQKIFEAQRAQIEANNLEAKKEAESVAKKLDGQAYVLIRQASDMGQLYGSVSSRDIAEAATEGGFTINRAQVVLNKPLKTLGISDVRIVLHPEVSVNVTVNIARSEEEAEAQARGENVLARKDEDDAEADEAALQPEDAFDNPEQAAELAGDDATEAPEAEASADEEETTS
jgi:large subunit ribosomal protein L9